MGEGDGVGSPISRSAVTILAIAVMVALRMIPLPGFEWDVFRDSVDMGLPSAPIGMLGPGPLIEAFLLVEFVAWLVPPLRELRRGPGRATLTTVALALTLIIATVQASSLAQVISESASMSLTAPLVSPFTIVVSLVGCTALTLLIAALIQTHGMGNGLSVAIACDLVLDGALPIVPRPWGDPELVSLALAMGCAAVVMVLLVAHDKIIVAASQVSVMPQTETPEAPRLSLPAPACGIVPVALAAMLLKPIALIQLWPEQVEWLTDILVFASQHLWWLVVATFALGVLLSYVFNPSRNLESVLRALGRGARAEGVEHSLRVMAVVGGLCAAGVMAVSVSLPPHVDTIDIVPMIVIAAVSSDLVGEAVMRFQHPDCVALDRIDHPYAAHFAQQALLERGIPTFTQGLLHRALFHLFAPYVGIRLLVPRKHAGRATTVLRRVVHADANAAAE